MSGVCEMGWSFTLSMLLLCNYCMAGLDWRFCGCTDDF